MSLPLNTLNNQFYATRALDILKMKAFVPCDVDDRITNYKGTITEIVYNPLKIPEVNERFKNAGFFVPDDWHVIAATDDGSILIWGGLNSVFHVQKGEQLTTLLDGNHMAFNDIRDLTARFKTKNKRVEIDELIAGLEKTYDCK